ncbi:nucleotidyltransferase family protein [Candidatus Woesearchaeota archaeon]|nr:nucleotidyltransferase family protein [Candidatus Woesearchaeota archaeon]
MKAIVLVGGYAKRLYPLTQNTPKALLPVAGKPIVHYMLEELQANGHIDTIYLSTNRKFESHFKNYLNIAQNLDKTEIIVENSDREENKLGAIGALNYLITQNDMKDDLMFLAGDNIFENVITSMINTFIQNQRVTIGVRDRKDIKLIRNRYGVIETDKECIGKVIGFEEKPDDPKSTLISTGIYIIPRSKLHMIIDYCKTNNNLDAPGYFFQWLIKNTDVYSYEFTSKWFDIGQFDQLNEAAEYFANKNKRGL